MISSRSHRNMTEENRPASLVRLQAEYLDDPGIVHIPLKRARNRAVVRLEGVC
jgi:hypothetical protein